MPASVSLNTKLTKTRWFEYFLYVLIIGGSIIGNITSYFVSTSNNSNQLIQTSIVGYITAITGLLFATAISIKFHNSKLKETGTPVTIFSSYILYSLPSILTIAVIIYLCVVILSYKDQLINGRVADEYYRYSTATSLLLGIQSVILIYHMYQQMQYSRANKEHTYKSTSNYSIYILTTLNIILVGISQVILKFFSTDG
tara:strand:- start:5095 stop:5691 length:597 start_codon:yes stop_codon:yes gene_type:complete